MKNITEFKQTKNLKHLSENRLDITEKTITETEGRVEEMTQNSYQRWQKIGNVKGGYGIWQIWIRMPNIYLIRTPKRENRDNGGK